MSSSISSEYLGDGPDVAPVGLEPHRDFGSLRRRDGHVWSRLVVVDDRLGVVACADETGHINVIFDDAPWHAHHTDGEAYGYPEQTDDHFDGLPFPTRTEAEAAMIAIYGPPADGPFGDERWWVSRRNGWTLAERVEILGWRPSPAMVMADQRRTGVGHLHPGAELDCFCGHPESPFPMR